MRFRHAPIYDIDQLMDCCAAIVTASKTLNKMREIMNHRRRMERLQQEIRDEQQAMDNCGHEWGASKYDPEDYMKPYGSKQTGAGSDPYWEPEGYSVAQKDRWSRECTKRTASNRS